MAKASNLRPKHCLWPWSFAFFSALTLLVGLFLSPKVSLIQSGHADTDKDQKASSQLVFETASFNFGKVQQGQEIRRVFRFRNTGKQTLVITRVKSSCGCTFPSLKTKSYAPGKQGSLTVTFDSKGRVGRQHKTITVESNDPKKPRIILEISGVIIVPPRPVINIQPEVVRLGLQLDQRAKSFSFILKNVGQKRLEVKIYQQAKGLTLKNPGPWSIPSGAALIQHAQIQAPTNEMGLVKRQVYFQTNDPEHPFVALEIQTFTPIPDGPQISLSQYKYDFGWQKTQGQGIKKQITVFNYGNKTLTIHSVKSRKPSISVNISKRSILPKQSSTLTITIQKPQNGSFSSLITLRSNSTLRSLLTVDIKGFVGSSASPKEALLRANFSRPMTWNVGALKKGQKLKATVAITNDGKLPLQWPRLAPGPNLFRIRRIETKDIYKAGETVHYALTGLPKQQNGHFQLRWRWPLQQSKAGLTIQGTVHGADSPRASLDRNQLIFQELTSQEHQSQSLILTNTGQRPLKFERRPSLLLTGENQCLRFKALEIKELAPGQSTPLTVEYHGRAALGLVQGLLVMSCNDPTQRRLRIPISGWIQAPKKYTALRILYNSDEAGEIEPCGCGGTEQLGGLPRLASAVKKVRCHKDHPRNCLTLSVGDIAGGPHDIDRRRAKAAFKSLGLLKYQAFVPGELDLALGLKTLQSLAGDHNIDLVCANIVVDPQVHKPVKTFVIKTMAGLKVAITGLLNRDLVTRPEKGVSFKDPVEAFARLLPTLKKQSDLVVLLAHMGQRRAVHLCSKVPGADVVIVGHAQEVMSRPRVIEGSHYIANPDQGKRLGILDLALTKEGIVSYRGQNIALDGALPNDPIIDKVLEHYRKGLRDLTPKAPAKDPKALSYVGDEACSDCHVREHQLWKQSRHARAMLSLEQKFNDFDPRCTICHTVGQGKVNGFTRRDLSPKLTEVQCESCHGPGSAHAETPKEQGHEEGFTMPAIGLKSCRSCHNGLHSPRFHPEKYWTAIAHGERSLNKIWDRNKDTKLDPGERKAMAQFQKLEAEKERKRRAQSRKKQNSGKN